MECLEWSQEHNAVAVPELDEQHQAIFEMANSHHQALIGGALLAAIEPGVRELVSYVVAHFACEERLMRCKRYPAYTWHKGQHDNVRTKLVELENSLKKGDREAIGDTLDYLTAWLQTHTAVSDRMIGAFLRLQALARTRYPRVPAVIRSGAIWPKKHASGRLIGDGRTDI